MPAKKSDRCEVFVSYSHIDKKWLGRLQVHLKPLERDRKVVVWSDTKLRGGDKWRTEIAQALSRAKVAILLASADFLASDFIHSDELPPLLQASEKEGLVILPVIIGRCAFTHSPIGQFQAINDPVQPLNNLTEGQVDEVFFQLYGRVHSLLVQPSMPANHSKPKNRAVEKAATMVVPTEQVAKKTTKLPVQSNKDLPTVASPRKRILSPAKKPANDSALLVKRNGEWEVIPVSQCQVNGTLDLVLRPATATQRAFLTSLRQSDNLAGVVFRLQTYLCKMQSLQTKTEGQLETWHLNASVQEINPRTEITYNSITPDMQAEAQAKLLLLDESVTTSVPHFWGYGGGYLSNIKESPFPALFQMLSQKPSAFQKTAPLVATWFLQLSNTVEHILKLKFSLKGKELKIQFEGQRRDQYQESPSIIRITGTCDLSRSVTERPLRLGPLSRY